MTDIIAHWHAGQLPGTLSEEPVIGPHAEGVPSVRALTLERETSFRAMMSFFLLLSKGSFLPGETVKNHSGYDATESCVTIIILVF